MRLIRQKIEISPEEFCTALVAKLVLLDRRRIPIEDSGVERIFGHIVVKLRESAIKYYEDEPDFSRAILEVLDGIRPNQNTGAFDSLWATFRRLQPGLLGVSNPFYPALEIGISSASASDELAHLNARWVKIVDDSANQLAKVI